jgi:hypothetical protein
MPLAAQPGGSRGLFFFRTQRAYSNSKLAQIYHSRMLQQKHPILSKKARIVNVCPAWVATSIARSNAIIDKIVNQMGFPADGLGLASCLYAILSDTERDYIGNTKAFDVLKACMRYLPSWAYAVGLRDFVALVGSLVGMVRQKFSQVAGPENSSPESYDMRKAEALYDWSYEAIAKYL